jgi:hypothetical protein
MKQFKKGQIVKVATLLVMPGRTGDGAYQWQYGIVEKMGKDRHGNILVNVTYGNHSYIKGGTVFGGGVKVPAYTTKENAWFKVGFVKPVQTEKILRGKELIDFANLFGIEFKCLGE